MMILHTGDLQDFVSEANIDFIREQLGVGDWYAAAGNHEYSQYVGEAREDAAYRMQSYAKVEKIFKESWGNLWDLSQDSRRWTILRYNNFHHSTVTLNDGLHNVNGVSEVRQFIDTDKEKGMSLDMTEVFAGQAKSVGRTVKILDDTAHGRSAGLCERSQY